jgi:hypothetical protein
LTVCRLSYRVVQSDEKAFFVVGFAKNERNNIDRKEETALKKLAKELFSYTDEQLQKAIAAKEWFESSNALNLNLPEHPTSN